MVTWSAIVIFRHGPTSLSLHSDVTLLLILQANVQVHCGYRVRITPSKCFCNFGWRIILEPCEKTPLLSFSRRQVAKRLKCIPQLWCLMPRDMAALEA